MCQCAGGRFLAVLFLSLGGTSGPISADYKQIPKPRSRPCLSSSSELTSCENPSVSFSMVLMSRGGSRLVAWYRSLCLCVCVLEIVPWSLTILHGGHIWKVSATQKQKTNSRWGFVFFTHLKMLRNVILQFLFHSDSFKTNKKQAQNKEIKSDTMHSLHISYPSLWHLPTLFVFKTPNPLCY